MGRAPGARNALSGVQARQAGNYVARCKGRGMEFDETRPYVAGDDVRSLDWKVTARSGRPHTKLFREERERPVFIAVDYRPAMFFATRGVFKSVLAARLAALLSWNAQRRGDRLGGQILGGGGLVENKPRHGRGALLQWLQCLVDEHPGARADIDKASFKSPHPNPLPGGEGTFGIHVAEINAKTAGLARAGRSRSQPGFNQSLTSLARHARPGSLVYLLSDFRGLEQAGELALGRLAAHCQVVLVFIYDPFERQPPSGGGLRISDGPREALLSSAAAAAQQQRFAALSTRLQNLTRRYGVRLIDCPTTTDPWHLTGINHA